MSVAIKVKIKNNFIAEFNYKNKLQVIKSKKKLLKLSHHLDFTLKEREIFYLFYHHKLDLYFY